MVDIQNSFDDILETYQLGRCIQTSYRQYIKPDMIELFVNEEDEEAIGIKFDDEVIYFDKVKFDELIKKTKGNDSTNG